MGSPRRSKFIALTCLLASTAAHAHSTAQKDAAVTLILNTLNTPSISLSDAIRNIAAGIRTSQSLCSDRWNSDVADCLRGDDDNSYQGALHEYIDYAVKQNKLDPVEGASLEVAFSTIATVKGSDPSGITLLNAPLKHVSGNGTPLPTIVAYRANKADFAALRTAKGQQVALPAALAQQMTKQFIRQVQGVGNVTPEQYFAAQMGRLQLNEVAGLMVTAADFLSRPDAKVMMYPAGYNLSASALKNDIQQEIALAQQIAAEGDPTKRTALQAQLTTLTTQTNAAQQRDQVDALTDERAIANSQLMTVIASLANPLVTDDQRLNLGTSLQTIQDQINGIDSQLGNLIRSEALPPEDVQRLAINSLQADFQSLIQESPFNQMRLTASDALLAAWVSGDISSDALTALCQFPGLKETRPNIWTQALAIAWDIAKPALMAFPTTSYIAIAITVLLDIQQSGADKEKPSDDTHLIPIHPS